MNTSITRATYFVLTSQVGWRIKQGDRTWNYSTKEQAVAAAVSAARQTWARGMPAQVLVQGRDGKWQTEWTYGNDPFPPRG